jgi:hypothetical protein
MLMNRLASVILALGMAASPAALALAANPAATPSTSTQPQRAGHADCAA